MSTHQAGDTAVGTGNPDGTQDGPGNGEGSQRETGGSGGSALTGDQAGGQGGQRPAVPEGQAQAQDQEQELADSGARGARDTRSKQAKSPGSGLGTPETGANQEPGDMAHDR